MPPRWSWARPMSTAISHRAWAAMTLPSCSQRDLDAMFGSATDPRPTGARCTAHATTSTTRSCRSVRAIGARWWKAFYGGNESSYFGSKETLFLEPAAYRWYYRALRVANLHSQVCSIWG